MRVAVNGKGSSAMRGLARVGALKTGWSHRMSRLKFCRTAANARTAGEAARVSCW